MQRLAHAFILAALLLAGCRGSDTAPSPAPVASVPAKATEPAPEPSDSRPLIVCFGDSLTAGYGAEAHQSYPDHLQADLDAAGYSYHVRNEGVSGATSKDGVARLPAIVALHPAIVVVEFGGNDGLRGLSTDDLSRNLDTMISTLKIAQIQVVLAGISLPPDYGPDYIQRFTAIYPTLAKKHHVPLLPFLLKDVFGVPGMMQADRTHATAEGNEIVAKNILAVLQPLLKK
ncbi:MAG TPA: arylesterase [Granulicella sp.]